MIKKLLSFLTIFAAAAAHAGTVTGIFQGPSGLPVRNSTLTFTLNQAGLIVGTGSVAQLSAQCFTSTDGSVVGLPNPLVMPTVATGPTGTLASGIYFVKFTFYSPTGESLPSPEFRIQTTVLQSLIVSPPATFPAGATGMNVYIGTTSGAETLQGSTTSPTAQYSQSVPLAGGSTPPTANSAPCVIAFNDQIIPYGGYSLALTSATGNAYPGFPQAIQLNGGPNGTVNVSQGLPLWNGTVVYPMPILSQPLNHGPQSISGPLDFGGYDVTNVGNMTAGTVNSVVNAALQPGADLPAKIANALASCGNACTIYVPAGSYSFSNSIILPYGVFGQYKLQLDPGAVLHYTGSSDAILTQITTAPTAANLIIEGGELLGNPNATSAIHLKPSQKITIRNMVIVQFTGGDAILNEGANGVNIYDNILQINQNGVHNISTLCNGATPVVCSPTGSSGSAFSPNAVHVHDNIITNNGHWGIFEEWNAVTGSTGALGNHYFDNVLELNGTAGPTFGAAFIMKSVADVIGPGNYFEGSPREVVLGQLTGGAGDFFAALGVNVIGNYFTTSPPVSPATKAYNIELQNVSDTLIEGNGEQGTGGISNTTNCFVNASTGGEVRTLIGRNAIFQGQAAAPTSGNPICINGTGVLSLAGAGSMSLISQNFQSYIAFQNFMTTAVTSEPVAVQYLTSNGSCYVEPINSAAASDTTAHISTVTNGSATFVHAATANEQFNVFCVNSAVNGFGYP